MSAFWKKENKKEGSNTEKGDAVKAVAKSKVVKVAKDIKRKAKKEKKSDKNGLIIPAEKADLINKVLISPMISEAVMNAQEIGKYTFEVSRKSTKHQVALVIEALYKVSVEKVNIINYKAQSKFFRGKKGRSKGYKKAIITLKKGDKIKLFS